MEKKKKCLDFRNNQMWFVNCPCINMIKVIPSDGVPPGAHCWTSATFTMYITAKPALLVSCPLLGTA